MLDLTKPIRTRDGREVRILCTDGACTHHGAPQPIVGIVGTLVCTWNVYGMYSEGEPSSLDLINPPPPKKKVTVEVRLWKDTDGTIRSASCVMRIDTEWGQDDKWLASTTIEMEYEEQA